MSDGGPAEEETGEYEETEDVSADRLWNCQYGSMSFLTWVNSQMAV